MSVRLAFSGLILLLATGCVDDRLPVVAATAAVPQSLPAEVPAAQWRAVLVAGDSSSPAFDNGVEALRGKLSQRGVTDIAVYSADPASVPPQRMSTAANLRAGFGAHTRAAACLAFVTTHGNEDGVYLRPDRRIFPPSALDRALNEGCGALPTVVVISACHSGTFIDNGARRPNRIVLTAAATNRTSFGCGADDEYTNYDYCLLKSFDGAETWGALAAATTACVEGLERTRGVRPSRPQLYVGAAVANLRLPGR
ncbi:MAG: hypothetical protein JSR24_08015 [Proteobacteria bacterium]|nr:hypothetical protein [Pseudomonadota bacterium]